MPTFSIMASNGKSIGDWDFALSPAVSSAEERPSVVVEEAQHVGFVLAPSDSDWDYRIRVGDRAIAEEAGDGWGNGSLTRRFGDMLCWVDAMHFESARGCTNLYLEARPTPDSPWELIATLPTYVLPTKLGEERYDAMVRDLRELCGGLLLDLLGTSRQKSHALLLSRGVSYRSKEEELRVVDLTWRRLQPLLERIAKSPNIDVVRTRTQVSYWGSRDLTHTDVRQLASRGIDPREHGVPRPLRLVRAALRETTDIREHHIIAGFVRLLQKRLIDVVKAIGQHRAAIQGEKRYRDIQIGGRPSLFSLVDAPRLRQLASADMQAKGLLENMVRLMKSSPLRDCTPETRRPSRHLFTQGMVYRSVRDVIDRYMNAAHFWTGDGDGAAITKLSSRMYEQWVLMGLVEAFREQGLALAPWEDVLSTSVRERFTIDFERGLEFRAALTPRKSLRIRYEPWILPREDAKATGETLCHGARSRVPWCPDVIVECLVSRGDREETLYGVAIDCKYSMRVAEHHWHATRKYTRIRATASNRQVVRQLWIAYPGEEAEIQMVDPGIRFENDGPTCPVTETVEGILPCMPGVAASRGVLERFAGALLHYLKRVPLETTEE
jgi:hypothetical protein